MANRPEKEIICNFKGWLVRFKNKGLLQESWKADKVEI